MRSDILPAQPRRQLLMIWAVLAILNLSAGMVVATLPDRHADFDTIHRWGHEWLVDRVNIYETEQDPPDYPPHALVLLSPLGTLPPTAAAYLWALVSLLLAPITATLALRAANTRITATHACLPVLMFLCWGSFRTLLQFSLITMACGLLSMVLAERRPLLGGFFLALSLMKPQMAVPFFLWAVLTRRMRVVAAALAVVIAGVLIYSVRVAYSPIALVARYVEILRTLYTGNGRATILAGLAQVRPLLRLVTENATVVDLAALVIALILLLVVGVIAIRESGSRRAILFSAPPLVGIWSLLTFYHLSYGFSLLLPTATLLLFLNDPQTLTFRRRLFWCLQLVMMFDVVTAWRWLGPLLRIPESAGAYLMHADRLLMLALFGAMVILFLKTESSPGNAGSS